MSDVDGFVVSQGASFGYGESVLGQELPLTVIPDSRHSWGALMQSR